MAVLLWRVLKYLDLPFAWFAAALFAVHPVNVESVAWMTELKNVQSAALATGALLAYLRFALPREPGPVASSARESHARIAKQSKPLPVKRRSLPAFWYAMALLLFTGSVLSKTVTCSLPAVILLLIWWKRGRLRFTDVAGVLPFFAIGLFFGLLTAYMESKFVGAVGPEWDYSLAQRCIIAGRAIWFYAAKLLWPSPLIFIYPLWKIDAGNAAQWLYPITALALPIALFLLRKRIGRGPLTAVLIFGGVLFPALGFINTYPMRYSFVADHFQYHAAISMIVLMTGMIWWATQRLPADSAVSRTTFTAAVAILLVLGSALSWRQAHAYKSMETLWEDVVAKNPDGWMGLVSLGVIRKEQGRTDEAESLYRRSLDSYPQAPEAHHNLAVLLSERGDKHTAISHYKAALDRNPEHYGARNNLALALSEEGEMAEAEKHFRLAINTRPGEPAGYVNLGVLYARQERLQEAATTFMSGLSRHPYDPNLNAAMARLLAITGRKDQALFHARRALEVNPNLQMARDVLTQLAAP